MQQGTKEIRSPAQLTDDEIKLLIAVLQKSLTPTEGEEESSRLREASILDGEIVTIRETEEKLVNVLNAYLPENDANSEIIIGIMSNWFALARQTQIADARMRRDKIVPYSDDEINAFGSDEESTKKTLQYVEEVEYEVEDEVGVNEAETPRFPGNSGHPNEKDVVASRFFSVQEGNFPTSEQILAFVVACLVGFILYNLR